MATRRVRETTLAADERAELCRCHGSRRCPKPCPGTYTRSPASRNPTLGRRAMDQYACPTCHIIPGVTGATQQIGPPLAGIASRSYIAGALTNTPDNMVKWLQSPPAVKPRTAMPDLGLAEQDAWDIAAYLASLLSD